MSIRSLEEHLLRYLSHDTSLAEFERWFVANLPSLLDQTDSGAADLSGSVQLALAEMSQGLIDQSQFKKLILANLWELVEKRSYDPPSVPSWTNSASSNVLQLTEQPTIGFKRTITEGVS